MLPSSLRGKLVLTGPARFKRRLLARLGWRTVSLAFHELRALDRRDARRALLRPGLPPAARTREGGQAGGNECRKPQARSLSKSTSEALSLLCCHACTHVGFWDQAEARGSPCRGGPLTPVLRGDDARTLEHGILELHNRHVAGLDVL